MIAWLVRDWHLKILAVGVAFALWLFVVGSERRQVSAAAPVEYVGVPADAVLVGDLSQRVELQLEATRWAARRVTPESLRVRVNVATAGEGESLIPVSPSDVEAPPGVRITRITPPWVRVSLIGAIERTLPVAAQVRGHPAAGFAVRRVTVAPSTVVLKGPRTTIERRDRVETAPVDVTGSRASVTQSVRLLVPELVAPTRGDTVEVTVEIQPEDRMQRRGGGT
jgi:YbbR domain-containing protein